jgi:hypothetical protein
LGKKVRSRRNSVSTPIHACACSVCASAGSSSSLSIQIASGIPGIRVYNLRRIMTESTHVHILGIAGTFMGGLAAIAKAAGFRVTGADLNVYPPMSTQLEALGIQFVQGYGAEQLDLRPDIVVVGNALSRGSQVIEAMLDRGMAYASGPQWLSEHVLKDKHVIAVAGTHGKTTTTAMLTWILEEAGLAPGAISTPPRVWAAGASSSSRRMNTTPRFSTSARSSSTTGRARRFSIIWNTIMRISIRT